jgi:exosortase
VKQDTSRNLRSRMAPGLLRMDWELPGLNASVQWGPKGLVAVVAVLASLTLLYTGVLRDLVRDWSTDDNYSHGFLIIPIAAYFAWERRKAFASAAAAPSIAGLGLIVAGLGLLVAGVLGAELFLTRISLLWVLAGGIMFVLGWQHLRVVLFPLLFLVLMIPIPALIFNQVAFPLQLVASTVGAAGLSALNIPVLREGNVIALATIQLEVAEACSGIRSLISLLTLGIVLGYFMDGRSWVRMVLALATVPIAVLSNGLRVAGTGVAAHYYGNAAAEGFMHTFSGWIVFVVALAMLLIVQQILSRLFPEQPHRRPQLAREHDARAALRA